MSQASKTVMLPKGAREYLDGLLRDETQRVPYGGAEWRRAFILRCLLHEADVDVHAPVKRAQAFAPDIPRLFDTSDAP